SGCKRMFFYEGTFIDRRLRAETLLGPRRPTKMSVARATTVCLLTLLPPLSPKALTKRKNANGSRNFLRPTRRSTRTQAEVVASAPTARWIGMQKDSPQEITQLLVAWSDGDESALARLTPLVYEELHRLAHHYMSGERAGHT